MYIYIIETVVDYACSLRCAALFRRCVRPSIALVNGGLDECWDLLVFMRLFESSDDMI